jgi:hypothetical protein
MVVSLVRDGLMYELDTAGEERFQEKVERKNGGKGKRGKREGGAWKE